MNVRAKSRSHDDIEKSSNDEKTKRFFLMMNMHI